jgi:endonuclease/exonuclease/phosphatase (EEP) superfamily protein YafD
MVSELKGQIIVSGDCNLPADSAIFRDCWSKYDDAFCVAGFGFGYTKFMSKWGLRIDHILVNDHWRVRRCWVGADVGSSHRPVIAEIERKSR